MPVFKYFLQNNSYKGCFFIRCEGLCSYISYKMLSVMFKLCDYFEISSHRKKSTFDKLCEK